MRRYYLALAVIMIVLMLCGCAANPDKDAVVSKNNGSFDAGVIQSATAPAQPQEVYISESFTSTDGSVEFSLNLDQTLIPPAVPVVEVVPHYLTGEDAKRVCQVLFGENAVFYEKEPTMAPLEQMFTRAEAMEALQRWAKYTNLDALRELYGKHLDTSVQDVQWSIEELTEAYEKIPEKFKHREAEWTIKSDAYYHKTAEQIEAESIDPKEDNDAIRVMTNVDGILYGVNFVTRNRSDYKLNQVYAELTDLFSPAWLDVDIMEAELTRTEEPTEEQVEAVAEKAQKLLDEVELGQWKVDQCYTIIDDRAEKLSYTIYVTAVPLIEGVPAIRRPQLYNLKSDNAYASNYYLTDAMLVFSAEGKLIDFTMYSPIDVKEVLNDNVATMTMDELVQRAKEHLSLSDMEAYGLEGELLDVLERGAGEDFYCKIELCEMEYGMFRVKVPNTDESYYYVPGAMFYATIDYCGNESGEIYASSGTDFGDGRVIPLLALNAVDGSVITLTN